MLGSVRKKSGTAAPGWGFDPEREKAVAGELAHSGWRWNFALQGRNRKPRPTHPLFVYNLLWVVRGANSRVISTTRVEFIDSTLETLKKALEAIRDMAVNALNQTVSHKEIIRCSGRAKSADASSILQNLFP